MRESVRLVNLKEAAVVLLLLLKCIGQVTGFPSFDAGGAVASLNSISGAKVTRQDSPPVDETPDPNIPVLESLAAKLDIETFQKDLFLLQKLDRVNEISRYNDPKDNKTTVFERQVLDTNKSVVVLSSSQDSRSVKDNSKKRTYVILRRAPPDPEDPRTAYYLVGLAYVRDARAKDNATEVITVGGKGITVEWDNYESRPSSATRFHMGWNSCAYTVLFTCSMNYTAIEVNVDNKTLQAITIEATTPSPVKAAETTVAPVEVKAVDPIVGEAGFDPQEYTDLYGDFDLVIRTGVKTGRGIFGTFGDSLCRGFSIFGGGGDCVSPDKDKKKTFKIAQSYGAAPPPPGVYDPLYEATYGQQQGGQQASTYGGGYYGVPSGIATGYGIGLSGYGASRPQISNADAIFGTYYVGVKGTPPIFLPDATQTAVLFVPDNMNAATFTAHGFYVAGTAGYPDTFIPDDPLIVAKIYSSPGTMIPDGMTMASITGGIHGTLSGESFRPDTLGTSMWFNPESPESKGAWTPTQKASNKPSRPKTNAAGALITYGVYFPGVSGSPDIFIPEGEGIPGYFVPNDPTKPEIIAIPHGSFIATKPAGHGSFYADNIKEMANVQQVRGAFMPDGMNLTGAIAGRITKDVANSFVFVVDPPGQEFSYFKGKPEAAAMWAPFLKPGEWKPPATTPAPAKVEPVTKPSAAAAAKDKKKVTNPSFMFGIKFPGQSAMDIFIPDNHPVEGQMFPEDSSIPPVPGQMIVSKQPNTPFIFRPTNPASVASLPGSFNAMFIPEGIAGGNGIMGELTLDETKQNYTYVAEPPGKGYWYIQGKPENLNVWTPFIPPVVPPTTRRPTIIDKIQTQAFLTGFYVPGQQGAEPVFIPEAGAIGCFIPDDTSKPKSCGTYYPETPGSPAEFVQDVPNKIPANTPGNFIPQLSNGSVSVEKFHAIFSAGPPSTFKLDKPSYQGWSQTNVKVSTTTKTKTTTTTNVVTEETRHPPYTPIEVGGGFVGYPTNNKGIDSLVDPNSPIFKEFLQWKSRKDKSITENDKIMIISNNAQAQSSTKSGTSKTSYVSLEEYKSYVEERYTIKTTKIKTNNINEMVELAVPKAAEKYVKKKKKEVKININVNSKSYAGAGAGAGAGGSGGGGAGGGGSGAAGGGASGSGLGGGKCQGKWSTSASATAIAQNGSNANSDAHAINGGDAKAMSLAKDGANADSSANVKDGGKSNAMAQAKNKSNATAASNALNGAIANSLSKTSKDGAVGLANANAKSTGEKDKDGCDGGGLPEEIEVDSHAAATALTNGTGTGGNVVNSYANTNVKIDMGSLMAKIMEMQKKQAETDDDDDDESPPFNININTDSQAGAGAGAGAVSGRTFGDETPEEGQGRSVDGKAAGIKTRVGWKTEYKIIEPNCTLKHEDQIFYGLGTCPYTTDPDPKSAASDNPEDVINFYLKILRVDCIEKVKIRVMGLFNDDFLTFSTEDDGDYLQLPVGNTVRNKAKITDAELRKLSSAFEIAVFTRTYFQHMNISASTAVAPYIAIVEGPKASRSLRFMTEFALNFVTSAREMSPSHSVRLTRNMLTTIRTMMVKLHQDGELLKACAACTQDIEMNRGDKIQAMGLLQFLIHGLGPYDKGPGKDIRAALTDFLKLNRLSLESRVGEYESQIPKQ